MFVVNYNRIDYCRLFLSILVGKELLPFIVEVSNSYYWKILEEKGGCNAFMCMFLPVRYDEILEQQARYHYLNV